MLYLKHWGFNNIVELNLKVLMCYDGWNFKLKIKETLGVVLESAKGW